MFLSGTMRINEQGNLEIGGCDTVDLAERFGTPLYVMDEEQIRKNCAEYRDNFRRLYPDSEVAYAGKAFLTTAMCRLVEEEGLALDVVSGGEIYTALQADFPPEKMIFHGNNKTAAEIDMALENGVGRFAVDSHSELDLLEERAARFSMPARVYLRIKPGIEAHTHHYIQTGQQDSKFGFGLSDGQALDAIKKVSRLKNVELSGLHCHIGSQIFDLQPFGMAAAVLMDFIAEIRKQTGITIRELDLGGGLGIRYQSEDSPHPVREYVELLTKTVKDKAAEHGLPLPKLMVEPGRSIIGEAGITLYTVGSTKDIPGIRKYVSLDGGMTDNLRSALYEAKYEAIAANKAQAEPAEKVTLAGRACESGDIIIRDIKLPVLERGDIVAVFSTGAYHYSMANNYNRFPRPPVIFARKGFADIVVQRETYEDLVRLDCIPDRLRGYTCKGSQSCIAGGE